MYGFDWVPWLIGIASALGCYLAATVVFAFVMLYRVVRGDFDDINDDDGEDEPVCESTRERFGNAHACARSTGHTGSHEAPGGVSWM